MSISRAHLWLVLLFRLDEFDLLTWRRSKPNVLISGI